METGEGSELFRKHHISGQVLRDELLRRGWIHQLRQRSDVAPRKSFVIRIMPERLALSAMKRLLCHLHRLARFSIGKLHLCLFGEGGVALDLLEDDTQRICWKRVFQRRCGEETDPFPASKQHRYYANSMYIGG